MPSRQISSARVAGRPVPARQATCGVWLGPVPIARVWVRCHLVCHWFPGLAKEVRPMTSIANMDDFTLFRIRGPVIVAIPPGHDPRPLSVQIWLLARLAVITGWRQEAGRGWLAHHGPHRTGR